MNKIYVSFFAPVLIFALFSPVFAETPIVTTFSVPSSLDSGQVANISWTIEGGGHSFMVSCVQGVKLLYSNTNLVFPCDTRVSISNAASDGVSLIVANVSGSARIITAKIIPKDANGGSDYNAGAREATVYVNPSRQPISGFYSTATTTVSGVPTKLSWVSTFVDGVNLKISCNDSVTATSTIFGNRIIPCGQIFMPTDLPGNSSIEILFNNQSTSEAPIDVTIFPAMSPGIYDGTHAITVTLNVASDAQKALSTTFNSDRTQAYSGDAVSFNWSILNGYGANIKFECSPLLSLQWYSNATTTSVTCGGYAFTNPLPATGSSSISFVNSNSYDETVTATVFPYLKSGTYDGRMTEKVQIRIFPASKVRTNLTTPVIYPTAPVVTPRASAPIITTISSTGKNVFKRALDIGSRGEDVRLLQIFLANDKTVYPEGLVTGTFGQMTKRAVGKFQIKYGLVKNPQEPAYGFVGPKTRTMLNSIY